MHTISRYALCRRWRGCPGCPGSRSRPRSLAVLSALALLAWLQTALPAHLPAHAAEWQVPLEISNGGGETGSITFGIHPDATPGIDPGLGEVGLPPWPPSDLFECRFMVAGSEGSKLDLRDTTWTARTHDIRWQAGQGGYPITVRWDREALPFASLHITDPYGGQFIPTLNMYEADSLLIPPEWSFLTRLKVEVIPGQTPGAEPVISAIPDQGIFRGQQFPEILLDACVFDPDTPDSLLQWFVTDNEALIFVIDENRVLRPQAPEGWAGEETVTLTVRDPELHTDHKQVTFTVTPGGLPRWTVPITVSNAAQEEGVVHFGVHPDGSDGLDPSLGEVELPPWPPADAFDNRLLFPDDLTYATRDIRASTGDAHLIRMRWQPGEGGYPVTITWPDSLPLAEFILQDELGGAYIGPLEMGSSSELVIPPEWDFILGVDITMTAVIDTVPPEVPEGFGSGGAWPDHWMRLSWEPIRESNFAYYEIYFDTVPFEGTEAPYVWDWTEDPALTQIETSETIIPLPESADYYYARIRSWDLFGNPGEMSPLAEIPTGVFTGIDESAPGDGRGRIALEVTPSVTGGTPVRIHWRVPPRLQATSSPRVQVFDLTGRQVWRWPGRHTTECTWRGSDAAGRPVPAGLYLVRLVAGGRHETRSVLMLR